MSWGHIGKNVSEVSKSLAKSKTSGIFEDVAFHKSFSGSSRCSFPKQPKTGSHLRSQIRQVERQTWSKNRDFSKDGSVRLIFDTSSEECFVNVGQMPISEQ